MQKRQHSDTSSEDDEIIMLAGASVALYIGQRLLQQDEEAKKRKQDQVEQDLLNTTRQRRERVKNWLIERPLQSQYYQLMTTLESHDEKSFRNYLRMDPNLFHEINSRIEHRLLKGATNANTPLEPGFKLAATLRFLATGQNYGHVGYDFRVSLSAVCRFIPLVCDAIVQEYQDEVLKLPTTSAEWKKIAEHFWQRWNFPHTIGAIDGKHVAIRAPRNCGSEYFCYKKFYSIILLGVVDADYKFIYVDIGAPGAASDAGVFNTSDFKQMIEEHELSIPAAEVLPGEDPETATPVPYFFVGDDAFALKHWMMKPFPLRHLEKEQRIFNYRLSRARRIVENAFGILASRFRCLLTTMQPQPAVVIKIVHACIILHNLLRMRNPAEHIPGPADADDDEDRLPLGELPDMELPYGGANPTRRAQQQRRYLMDFVNSEPGSVSWQDDML